MNKATLKHFYHDLTGDKSGSSWKSWPVVWADFIYLRALNSSKKHFDVFWSKAKEFLEEDIGTAVNDCGQSGIVHAAKATSEIFCQQLQQRRPPETPIPSDEWIKVPAHRLLQNTQAIYKWKSRFSRGSGGRSTKTHYGACIFRHIWEYAVSLRRLLCMHARMTNIRWKWPWLSISSSWMWKVGINPYSNKPAGWRPWFFCFR